MTTLERLSSEAAQDPLSSAAFEIWFHQSGFPGADKMAASYAWRELRGRVAVRFAALAKENRELLSDNQAKCAELAEMAQEIRELRQAIDETSLYMGVRGEEIRVLRGKLREEGECTWKDDDDGVWETSCGGAFVFTTDGPTENNMRFCPYCGKRLETAEEEE
jgi:hypothetical protein